MPIDTNLFWNTIDSNRTLPSATRDQTASGRITHDEFLQLLVMQLTNQDPLKPMEDIDFLGQMAQIQALDEQIAMTKMMQSVRLDMQLQSTSSFIGKNISWFAQDLAGNPVTHTGTVDRVIIENDTVYVQLTNGVRVEADKIWQVWDQKAPVQEELLNAQAMLGMLITAVDSNGVTYQGVALAASVDGTGVVYLQLHTGMQVPYRSVTEVSEWSVDGGDNTDETDETDGTDRTDGTDEMTGEE